MPDNASYQFDSASVTTQHMSRTSRAYLIYENELDSLAEIETIVAASWSVIAFCASMICSALWDIGYAPPIDDASSPAMTPATVFGWGWVLFWALVAGATGAFLYLFAIRRRSALVTKIVNESKTF